MGWNRCAHSRRAWANCARDLEQVVAEALQQVEAEPALGDEPVGQGHAELVVGIAGRRQSQRRPSPDSFDAGELDDPGMAELLQGTGLVPEPLGVLLVLGDLEHLGLGTARPAAQQRHRGRPATEPALDEPAPVEDVTLVGGERVGCGGGVGFRLGGLRCGEGVERTVEQVEQLPHRRPAGRHRVGGEGDERRQLVRQAIDRGVECQALVHGEHRLAFGQVAGGGLPGQQEEGEDPEGEHVQRRAVRVLDAEGLGRQVDLLGRVEAFGQVRAERRPARVGGMACEARGELPRARLPVPDDQLGQATGAAAGTDEHAPRGEGPMGHLPGMGVGDRLAELAHELDAGIEAQAVETSWSPQIEPLLAVDPLEEQCRAPFRLTRSSGWAMPSWRRSWTTRNSRSAWRRRRSSSSAVVAAPAR